MTGLYMESIVMAFMIGGIVGAITALHLSGALKSGKQSSDCHAADDLDKVTVKVKSNNSRRR
jgi:gas vesicle protein